MPKLKAFRSPERLQNSLIIQLTILTLIFSGVFLVLEWRIGIRHQIAVFFSFLLFPLLYLVLRHPEGSTPRQIIGSIGRFDKGFFQGILIYLVFSGYVFIYYLRDPDFFSKYDKTGFTLIISLCFTALNVMPIDFFTKRFIQYPLMKRYSPSIAISLQTLVWLLAHIPESLWLNELMGNVGVWIFLLFSGLVTGISYQRTKNIGGQMAGHVLLNIMVVLMAKL